MSTSKVQVTDHALAPPGKCVICGYTGGSSRDDRKFIDFQFDLDFYGAILFCSTCIVNVANQLGFTSPEQSSKLKLDVINLSEQLSKSMAENARLRSALDSVSFLRDGAAVRNDDDGSEVSVESSETNTSNVHGYSKSASKRGSKNVSSNDSNDEIDSILGI